MAGVRVGEAPRSPSQPSRCPGEAAVSTQVAAPVQPSLLIVLC